MANAEPTQKRSAFAGQKLSAAVEAVKAEIAELYAGDGVPWVIGYSGGKDSTAVLQLVWLALADIPEHQRTKPVHVISTDTLVENPVVAAWVNRSLDIMRDAAVQAGVPLKPHRLTPALDDSFWVTLIGKGYPAPRINFRWCTSRLKITPSNKFIRTVVRENGEAILVLGTRRAESQIRARNMAKHAAGAVRERLAPNGNLNNCLVYTPVEDWTNDDVWMFLMQYPNPWGFSNKDLMNMYRGASEDGECPLVVDTTTPSCGNSRFGCWVCTLVDQDKSMAAMIRNDDEKSWMEPMLQLRNELDFRTEDSRRRDRARRDFRRMNGKITFFKNTNGEFALVPGPYTQEARAYWLRRLLETQQQVRTLGPEYCRNLELISLEELQEIRRTWVADKHEIEDLVPEIYREVTGSDFPAPPVDDCLIFDRDALNCLLAVCGEDKLRYEMIRNLLDVERRYAGMSARRGLFEALSAAIERCAFEDAEDALQFAKDRRESSAAEDDEQATIMSAREESNGKVTLSLRQYGASDSSVESPGDTQ